jgi:hypothetical protein
MPGVQIRHRASGLFQDANFAVEYLGPDVMEAGVELAASRRIRVWHSSHRQPISGGRKDSIVAEIIADQVTCRLNCLYAVLAD